MATPTYNQVALPQLTGSAQAQALADEKITQGLKGISASITGLGTRLETRKQAQIDLANSKGKEILETALLAAKDDDEFNSIIEDFSAAANADGFVLPGQAAAILAQRKARNESNIAQETARGLGADADEGAAAARLKILEADAADIESAADKEFAPEMAAALALANRDPVAGLAAVESINAKRAAKYAGSDLIGAYTDTDNVANLGITTRSARDTELTDNATNATTRALQPSALRAGIAQNDFTTTSSRSQEAGVIRGDKAIADNEILNNVFAGLQRENFTLSGLLNAIDAREDLTPLQKNRISALAKNVNFDEINPVPEFSDPNKTASYNQDAAQAGLTRLTNLITGRNDPVYGDIKGLDPDITLASINDAAQRTVSSNPSFKIYDKAQTLKTEGTYSNGFVGDIGVMLSKQLGDTYEISPGETVIIKNLQTKYNLSNEEMVALVEASVKEDDGFRGLWNKPEIRNRTLEKKAAAYDKDRDNMAAVMATQQKAVSEANALGAQIKLAQDKAERAAQDNKPELARQYAAEAARYASQLRSYDTLFENAESAATEDPAEVAREIKRTSTRSKTGSRTTPKP